MTKSHFDMEALVADFSSVGLEDIGEGFLMKRREIKYFFHEEHLPQILRLLHEDFDVLEIGKHRVQEYKSDYLDTSDRQLYLKHHNSHANRYKFRFRHYVDSGSMFFEVKHRLNTGVTVKHRIPIESILDDDNQSEVDQMISTFTPFERRDFENELMVSYDRIGLIHKGRSARITLDQNVQCADDQGSHSFDQLVILELKFNKAFDKYQLMKSLRQMRLYPERISKYCMSTCKLHPEIKQNRFKRKLKRIDQIETQKTI